MDGEEIHNLMTGRTKKLHLPSLPIVLSIVIFLSGLCVAGYFYFQYQSLKNMPTPAAKATEEKKQLATEVGKLMLLPSDELPTIAIVTDITKLKDQPFFNHASNGQKVLIYTKAKLAIIYDPKQKKIINVGPLNVGPQPNQPPQAKIAILNGTTIAGLASKSADEVKSAFPGANIASTGQATKSSYDRTIVVALNPLAKNAAEILAQYYKAPIKDLPSDETKPEGTDIVILLGKDRVGTPSASQSPTPTEMKK